MMVRAQGGEGDLTSSDFVTRQFAMIGNNAVRLIEFSNCANAGWLGGTKPLPLSVFTPSITKIWMFPSCSAKNVPSSSSKRTSSTSYLPFKR